MVKPHIRYVDGQWLVFEERSAPLCLWKGAGASISLAWATFELHQAALMEVLLIDSYHRQLTYNF